MGYAVIRIAIALLLCLAPAAAHPHNSPTAWCDVEIKDAEVLLLLTARRDVLGPWLGLDLPPDLSLDPPAGATAKAELRARLERLFRERNRVRIDGEDKAPTIRLIRVPDRLEGPRKEEFLEITFAFPASAPPRRVAISWETFEGTDWQRERVVPGMVRAGSAVDLMTFSPGEPEYIWYAKDLRPPVPPRPVETPPPPPPFPYLSLVLIAAAGLGSVRLRRRGWAPVVLLLLAGGAGAAFAWPPAAGPVRTPSAEQARAIFSTLHRNVYRAFEADTEDGIYDLLAMSVDAPLVEQFYLDIYESLILRSQGGAVTRVEKIDVVESRVTLPPPGAGEPQFEVFWKWRVHCSVTHWGHTHRRINGYAADYTVRHDGRSWKIAKVAVRESERVDPDAEGG